MKKILFTLAILPFLAFVGCSSDDDDNNSKVDFGHNIELLYGEWRATSVEGIGEEPLDLTDKLIESLVKPTYVTFEKNGIYSSKGVLGEGTGTYTTKDKTIYTVTGDDKEDKISFEMTELESKTAKIKVNPQDIDFGIPIPEEIGTVTVVLTKQDKK